MKTWRGRANLQARPGVNAGASGRSALYSRSDLKVGAYENAAAGRAVESAAARAFFYEKA
jgi:hypothetical protein